MDRYLLPSFRHSLVNCHPLAASGPFIHSFCWHNGLSKTNHKLLLGYIHYPAMYPWPYAIRSCTMVPKLQCSSVCVGLPPPTSPGWSASFSYSHTKKSHSALNMPYPWPTCSSSFHFPHKNHYTPFRIHIKCHFCEALLNSTRSLVALFSVFPKYVVPTSNFSPYGKVLLTCLPFSLD